MLLLPVVEKLLGEIRCEVIVLIPNRLSVFVRRHHSISYPLIALGFQILAFLYKIMLDVVAYLFK